MTTNPISRPLIIGELMNNSYARARRAWQNRDPGGYQELARIQTELGASFLTFNIDGTQMISVTLAEMLEFLPKVIPAIQEVSDLPISFDNPDSAFHAEALLHFDRAKSRGRPLLNSLSVTRHDIDGMIETAVRHDMDVIVMASECQTPDGGQRAARTPRDIVENALYFSQLLQTRAGIGNQRIIVDPGLCPIASDTSGGVNLCLDAIRAIRAEPALEGIHISVGLSNFAIGSPREIRVPLEQAFLRLALDAGLDVALANPEKNTDPLPAGDPLVEGLKTALEQGRPHEGEDADEAGYRQLDALMELYAI